MRHVDRSQALLQDFSRAEAGRCVACGNCLYVCPVFNRLGDEAFSARGRNEAINVGASGAADPAGLSRCLLCGRCSAICPQGVQHDKVVLASRAEVFTRDGVTVAKALVAWLLMRPRMFAKALRLASRLQGILPRSGSGGAESETPVIRYLPTLFLAQGGARRIPSIAARFLSELVPEVSTTVSREKKPVQIAYFAGCATEFVYPHAGVRLIGLLNALGAEVSYPRGLLCCGIPILASGDAGAGRQLVGRNLELLRRMKPDFVVTGCATCASTLKDVWPTLLQGAEQDAAVDLATRVTDVGEVVRVLGGYRMPRFKSRLPTGSRVTYHYPCHSLRYPDASGYPVELLRQVFGEDYIELESRGCCGCGGSFSLHHYELSRMIGQDKIDAIRKTRADVVVTNCPGCMIQITDGLHRSGLQSRVVHLTEAIEPA